MPQGIIVPATKVGGETWFLLSYYGDTHLIRYVTQKRIKENQPDPSGHRVREVLIVTAVKWKPRKDITFDIKDIPALGPSHR